jgi:hypothetical protein
MFDRCNLDGLLLGKFIALFAFWSYFCGLPAAVCANGI